MSQVPEHLKYIKSHEWVRVEDDGSVTVGITDYAQEMLGDLVYVELPEVGQSLAVGEECGVVESVKSASDLYSPVGGEISAVNEELSDTPEQVNQDPYGGGWIFKLKLTDSDNGMDALLDAAAYQAELDAAE